MSRLRSTKRARIWIWKAKKKAQTHLHHKGFLISNFLMIPYTHSIMMMIKGLMTMIKEEMSRYLLMIFMVTLTQVTLKIACNLNHKPKRARNLRSKCRDKRKRYQRYQRAIKAVKVKKLFTACHLMITTKSNLTKKRKRKQSKSFLKIVMIWVKKMSKLFWKKRLLGSLRKLSL